MAPAHDGRETIVEDLQQELKDAFWSILGGWWSALRDAFASRDVDLRGKAEETVIALALALGKLERNLLAGLRAHQLAAG